MTTTRKFIRTCQECFHEQEARDPETIKGEKWRDLKCRSCKSEAMDYGSWREFDEQGKEVQLPEDQ